MRRFLAAILVLTTAGCMIGEDDIDNTDGDDLPDDDAIYAVKGNPRDIDIGFNGAADQFDYYTDYFGSTAIHPGPRLCHGYFSWKVGNQAPHAGDPTDHASRAYMDNWLAAAQGHCDEALLSLKSMVHDRAPSEAEFTAAFKKLASASWKQETGFTGSIAFTVWNEPNNAADDGSGLGVEIEPRLAARYYLAAVKICKSHDCKVAAGDFASNGDMWNDFEFNCANDNVVPSKLCKDKSSVNKSGKGASYLDKYKNEIANKATDYGLREGYRPEWFAFHGWHDTNAYLNNGSHCGGYDDCTLRRILKSLGGSWGSVKLWDTEDGIGQHDPKPSEAEQACGAAFLLRLQSISPRIHRLYLTRLHGGIGQLLDAHTPRSAMGVLAQRTTQFAGATCR